MDQLLDSRVAAVAQLGEQWQIERASPAFCLLLASSERELKGRSFLDFVVDEQNWLAVPYGRRNNENAGPLRRDVQITSADGRTLWVRANIELVAQGGGKPVPKEIALTDINDLRHVRSELTNHIVLLDQVLSAVDEVFWVNRQADGKNLYVSPSFERIWGVPASDLQAADRSWSDQIHPEDFERTLAKIGELRAEGKPFSVEYRIVRKDGTVRWIWNKGFPLLDANGEIEVYIGSAQDISERKHDEIELARLQAADNIGLIAADLAHNFNNLLAIIDLAAHAIERRDIGAEIAKKLASIHAAVDRGSEITKLLLSVSSRQMLSPGYVDVNVVLSELEPLIAASAGPNIRILYDKTSRDCPVYLDQTGLNQAIINLVTNSREAMPEGGEILIKTRVARESAVIKDGDFLTSCVVISIEDSGQGMSEHALRHATDPYFTTKSDGAGFGLAITNGFVKQSDGRLTFANRTGGGLLTRMIFPRLRQKLSNISVGFEEPARQDCSILVIDDEAAIADSIRDLLAAEGFDVTCAQSIRQAKDYLNQSPFALIICDIALRDKLTGVDLALWVKGKNLLAKVLLMSGYASSDAEIPEDIPFIRKPFKPQQFLDVVRNLLGDSAPGAGPAGNGSER